MPCTAWPLGSAVGLFASCNPTILGTQSSIMSCKLSKKETSKPCTWQMMVRLRHITAHSDVM
jgi:hypothetical protein